MSDMLKPQIYTARLEDKLEYNKTYTRYSFELIKPHRITFQAGQYVSIKIASDGHRRSYSICSTPDLENQVQTVVDHSPHGLGTKFLEKLQFGDQVELLAPLGKFVVPENLEVEHLVFIATGSGISPFKSMIEDQLRLKQDQRKITLHWGMRFAQDLFWLDEWYELMESFPNFSFHPVLSQAPDEWTLCRGRVTDCLLVHGLPKDAAYFLCGNQQMIEDVTQLLGSKEVPKEHIFTEEFY